MKKSFLEIKFVKSLLFVLFFIFFLYIFFFLFYVHETGHIIFGGLNNEIKYGYFPQFKISAFTYHPFLKFIPLPQQTAIPNGLQSPNFALGGPFFMILIFAFLSYIGYKRSRKKSWFLLLLSIAMFEIYGNIICGTDNLTGNPLPSCIGWLNTPIQFLSIGLFSSVLSYFVIKQVHLHKI